MPGTRHFDIIANRQLVSRQADNPTLRKRLNPGYEFVASTIFSLSHAQCTNEKRQILEEVDATGPRLVRYTKLTMASLTLKSLITKVGNSCSETGSTMKYWCLADRSVGQYLWQRSC